MEIENNSHEIVDLNISITEMPSLAPFLIDYKEVSLDAETALYLYERNWGQIDIESISEPEQALINQLIEFFGSGIFAPHN